MPFISARSSRRFWGGSSTLTRRSSIFFLRSSISALALSKYLFEVFVRVDNQSADGLAVAYKSLHLGEEGVLKLYVCVPFVTILQHKVEDLALPRREQNPGFSFPLA